MVLAGWKGLKHLTAGDSMARLDSHGLDMATSVPKIAQGSF